MLGGQSARQDTIGHEWRLTNNEMVKSRDTAAYKLMKDPKYKMPWKLPDGKYTATPQDPCKITKPPTRPPTSEPAAGEGDKVADDKSDEVAGDEGDKVADDKSGEVAGEEGHDEHGEEGHDEHEGEGHEEYGEEGDFEHGDWKDLEAAAEAGGDWKEYEAAAEASYTEDVPAAADAATGSTTE